MRLSGARVWHRNGISEGLKPVHGRGSRDELHWVGEIVCSLPCCVRGPRVKHPKGKRMYPGSVGEGHI
jgi:hypothetical protein